MWRSFPLFIGLFALSFHPNSTTTLLPSESELASQVRSHFILEDYARAGVLLEWGSISYPNSVLLKKLEVEQLSRCGQRREALKTWKSIPVLPEKEQRRLLEELAWGMLVQGEEAQQFTSRYFSLLGAFFTKDTRATFCLQRALRSSNAALRSIAVQMTADYRDPILIEEIVEMVSSERNQNVRYSLIQCVGRLKIQSLSSKLEQLLDEEKNDYKMRALITESLVHLYEDLPNERLDHLLSSSRTALRFLGARLIAFLDRDQDLSKLVALLDDPSIDIRIAALCSLGEFPNAFLKKYDALYEKIVPFSRDPNPYLALTASWLLLRLEPEAAQEPLRHLLYNSHRKIRLLTANAISLSGEVGLPLLKEALKNSADPFVRINCAYGLLSLREEVKGVTDELFTFLQDHSEKIMVDQYSHPLFTAISPSAVRHSTLMASMPEIIDQKTRLSMIAILAVVGDARAEKLVKEYLLTQNLSVGMAATVTLMREGSIEGLDLIRNYLNDSDPKIRLQAALALAFLWEDPAAVKVLTEIYEKVPYETKLLILEGLAGIGGMEQVPFLLERMEEPFFVLRIAASSAMIQALHH